MLYYKIWISLNIADLCQSQPCSSIANTLPDSCENSDFDFKCACQDMFIWMQDAKLCIQGMLTSYLINSCWFMMSLCLDL